MNQYTDARSRPGAKERKGAPAPDRGDTSKDTGATPQDSAKEDDRAAPQTAGTKETTT